MRLTAKLVIAFVLVSVILMAVNGYMTMQREVQLRERQIQLWTGNLAKVLFTTGGSDAVEVALKIARAATGRYKTISLLHPLVVNSFSVPTSTVPCFPVLNTLLRLPATAVHTAIPSRTAIRN